MTVYKGCTHKKLKAVNSLLYPTRGIQDRKTSHVYPELKFYGEDLMDNIGLEKSSLYDWFCV